MYYMAGACHIRAPLRIGFGAGGRGGGWGGGMVPEWHREHKQHIQWGVEHLVMCYVCCMCVGSASGWEAQT